MKKKILVSLCLALIMLLGIPSAALAADPTEFHISWDGSGWVGAGVTAGDDVSAGFETGGDAIAGEYTALDSNDNPYNYGVDSFSALLNADVTNGYIGASCLRTDSYAGMYGPAGQGSWSGVFVDGGTASIAYRTTTNYAQMRDCSYGYQLPGGHNVVVDADYYEIGRGIADGRGNSGELQAWGSGTAVLDCMSAEASGCWSLKLGRGCGCYTDASFTATGSDGHFEVTGTGVNSVTFNGMGVSSGGGSISIVADWLNSFGISDFSLTAN